MKVVASLKNIVTQVVCVYFQTLYGKNHILRYCKLYFLYKHCDIQLHGFITAGPSIEEKLISILRRQNQGVLCFGNKPETIQHDLHTQSIKAAMRTGTRL